ncbi:MAG: hypothetical protein OJF50_005174 [Nitrospira sp.]|nr:hypothetical protein [Nitrospira sp.]
MLIESSAHTDIGVSAPMHASRTTTRRATILAEMVMGDGSHLIIILRLKPSSAFSWRARSL